MKKIILALIITAVGLSAAINVTVSILPEVYFVKKIAGNLATVNVMVPPGSEPETYEPKPKQLVALKKSKLYFAIGVPFEKQWLKKFKNLNPKLQIVNTQKGIKKRMMQRFYHFDKQEEIELSTKELDPHIWLSPKLVKKIATNMEESFIKADPENRQMYQNNLNNFLSEINHIQKYGHNKLDHIKKREFLVFHPVWGYFADEFGLKQIPVQIEGKEPKPKTLMKLIKYAKQNGISVIFVQPEFSKKSAEVIAKNIDGKVITLDPLAKNWKQEMLKAIDTFTKNLR